MKRLLTAAAASLLLTLALVAPVGAVLPPAERARDPARCDSTSRPAGISPSPTRCPVR
jgi:hypothetical protein